MLYSNVPVLMPTSTCRYVQDKFEATKKEMESEKVATDAPSTAEEVVEADAAKSD